MKKDVRLPILTKTARKILLSGLPICLLAAVAFLLLYIEARKIDPLGAALHFSALMEYLLVCPLIVVGAACVVDLVEREK